MSKPRPERLAGALCIAAASLVMLGCDDPLAGDRPIEVRVQRVITLGGERVVSFTAMFPDGVETYIDRAPIGEPDMITVERDGFEDGTLVTLVRSGSDVQLPADGPEPREIDAFWLDRFRGIDALVDQERVPWSDAHGLLTPAQINAAETEGG